MSDVNSEHWTMDSDVLESFILQRIDESETGKLAAHLKLCLDCRQRVQTEKEFIAGIRRYGRLEMKYRLQQQVQHNQNKRYDWTQAASIAAAIILMFGALFIFREFGDFGMTKNSIREIVLPGDKPSQQAFWITGRVVTTARHYHETRSHQSNEFIIKKGHAVQTVIIHHAMFSQLPHTQHTDEPSSIRAYLERTPQGMQLTLYTDSMTDTLIAGIEPVTPDSLIVFYQRMQIAFHIPGGWAGKI